MILVKNKVIKYWVLFLLLSCKSDNTQYKAINSLEFKEPTADFSGWVDILSIVRSEKDCEDTSLVYASVYTVFSQTNDTLEVVCPCTKYTHKVGGQVWLTTLPNPKRIIYIPDNSSVFLFEREVVFGELYIPNE